MSDVDNWVEAVRPWLEAVLPGAGPIAVTPLVAGHSNIVLGLERADVQYVVRRPPFGELAASAHDVLREARLLTVLETVGSLRTPRVIGQLTEAPGPAYVMSRTPGKAIRNELPEWLDAASRTVLSADIVSTLAELHALPWEPFETAGLGRPGGYLQRQLKRWSGQRDSFLERGVRDLDDEPLVRRWLHDNLPVECGPALVHGDYKLDNVLIDPVTALVTGVLDWELATLGDPLADLGFLLAFWPDEPAAVVLPELTGTVTTNPGFLSRRELVAVYADASGLDVTWEGLQWYVALALWKTALLLEASYTRFLAGTTDDPFFACLVTGVPRLLAAAAKIATTANSVPESSVPESSFTG